MTLDLRNAKKVMVLGDWGVGKTSMLVSYTRKAFPIDYCRHLSDSTALLVKVAKTKYTLGLFDTDGQSEYDRLRPLAYPQTDVFLVCFRVTQRASFSALRTRWIPEIRHYCPDVPFIIVATQIDMRDGSDSQLSEKLMREKQHVVSTEEGERLAHQLGAAKYVECSALTQRGLNAVFEEAVIACLKRPADQRLYRRRGGKCAII
ncbi:small GTPase CDC42 [Mycena galopus ATCC 62051]|nr:small GTPase CDC42 [Mycena galopus ATCC 62051]